MTGWRPLDRGLVQVEASHARCLNFAMAHNGVPFVGLVRVTNSDEDRLHDVEVSLALQPGLSDVWSARIGEFDPGATWNLESIDLRLRIEELVNLTERATAQLEIDVSVGGDSALRERHPVEVLAYNEWNATSLPQLLAAFVLPNHPVIDQTLARMRNELRRRTGSATLSGYQARDPGHVRAVASSFYETLQGLGISYVNPPASFESTGQKVRTPEQVLEHRMGTCLDLTVFAASCLEQAGLHPLLLVTEGHAFPGVWLVEDHLAEAACEDPLRLRKRVELEDLCVFDAAAMAATPRVSFAQSEEIAVEHLRAAERFRFAVDVRTARDERILPVPARVVAKDFDPVSEGQAGPPAGVGEDAAPAPSRPEPARRSQPSQRPRQRDEASTAKRLERWKQKLLDLSLRNRLLNFCQTRKSLQVLCPDLPRLEDQLADGKALRLLPRPTLLEADDPRDAELVEARTGGDPRHDYLLRQLERQRLHAAVTEQDLDRRLVDLARAARLSLQEGGANTLYLALGFLAWYENPSSELRRLAPLLLLPVDLVRKTARERYRLRLREEETRVNVTLLEKLRVDRGIEIPGLEALPLDESGVDVPRILRLVRRAVADEDRWEVVEEVQLGLFSFAKFLMWRDLGVRTKALLRNEVVRHLVEGGTRSFPDQGPFPSPESVDEAQPAAETFCPLDADSSQLAAVLAVVAGRTFVLQGPPGTGKSQTITNLVAQCLATGRTVLFVSEKMAALEVVHRRLRSVGLGDFCLELHSNKARKKRVVEELGRAWSATATERDTIWKQATSSLDDLRATLNGAAEALHRPRALGESVFQATSKLIGLRDVARIRLKLDAPTKRSASDLATWRDAVDRLAEAGGEVEPVGDHPWRAVGRGAWDPELDERVAEHAGGLADAAVALDEAAQALTSGLCSELPATSLEDLEALREAMTLAQESPRPRQHLVLEPEWDDVRDEIGTWIDRGQERDRHREALLDRYHEDLFGLDLESLLGRFRRWAGAFVLLAWLMLWGARRALRRVARERRLPKNLQIRADLDRAVALRACQSFLDEADDRARQLLGRRWREGESDWGGIQAVVEWVARFRALVKRLGRRAEALGWPAPGMRSRLLAMATDDHDLLEEGSEGRRLVGRYLEALAVYERARQRVVDLLALDEEAAWEAPTAPDHLQQVRRRIDRWRAHRTRLRDWCLYVDARDAAQELGLPELAGAHVDGVVGARDLEETFERSFYEGWRNAIIRHDDALRGFHGKEHNRIVRRFADVDRKVTRLAKEVAHSRVAAHVPRPGSAPAAASEVGILHRELQKKRRHLPLRVLFERIPNLLVRLKPCLLMSPLSVAQYLDPSYPPFDLVVFDEASQIPVHDAVGAIARGEQAVVVGDTKQLPPTSFFMRTDSDDELPDEGDVEELESILDECLAAGLPELSLRWHYRSRHEALIAFSNHHYYGNGLHTFPAAGHVLEQLGVVWRHVPEGHYDRGRSRTNRAEAQAVVEEIVGRLLDRDRCDRSLGVVTFSVPQQSLIEDLLDEACRSHPEIERYFGDEVAEPVFVKNLENVQGDERDVMLFSVCYGPDLAGRVAMNFGPLNRVGGERRLNVAITRAREQLVVFSTLTPDRIDVARTRAVGVRHLKTFLDYAARGPQAIAEAVVLDPSADFDSPFEEAVKDALVARGWDVHWQVGCSGYRIDLAVVDPERPGSFLLGVECDGASYHSAKSARDRDRLRAEVLERLGWRLHRVWSADWWHDPDREVDRIEAAIAKVRATGGAGQPPASAGANSAESDSGGGSDRFELIASAPPPETETRLAVESRAKPPPLGKPYVAASLTCRQRTPDDFYDSAWTGTLRKQVLLVVDQEAPVYLKLLARRVAPLWGIERVTKRVLRRFRDVLVRTPAAQRPRWVDDFLWRPGQQPSDCRGFRVPGPKGGGKRSAEELPVREVANGARAIIEQNVSLPVEDLARETARLFGLARMGKRVEQRMTEGIRLLASQDGCRIEDGQATVT